MPVDPEPVFVIEGEGRDRFVLDDGAVMDTLTTAFRNIGIFLK